MTARLIRDSSSSATVAVCSLFIDIRCSRSCQQITVYGRADQTPFPILVGSWKMVWLTRISCLFIKQTVIAFSCSNVKLLFTHFIVDRIRIYAGCVHHAGCCRSPLTGLSASISLRCFLNRALPLSEIAEFHTVVACILCQRNRQAERADNAAAWNIQRGNHGILDIRLSFYAPHLR